MDVWGSVTVISVESEICMPSWNSNQVLMSLEKAWIHLPLTMS